MKILYIITKANWGGAQKYVFELAVASKAAGHEVVVAHGQGSELVAKLGEAGVRTVALGGLARDVGLVREWRAFWALYRLVRAERPGVLHLNSSKAGGLGALAGRLALLRQGYAGRGPRLRIIFTAHGWAFNEARPWWQKVIIYKFAWLTILLSHKTICVSQAIRRDTRFMPFVGRRLALIYNGTQAAAYLPKEEARHALWPGHEAGLWVGMLSELHPVKRVEDAIEAVAEVHGLHSELRLVVLGEGEEHERLAALIAARGLGGVVHLAGFVPGADRYLKAFDFFLQASRSEALGTAVIEAGLAGLPVVATRVGGVPEIVTDGETGLLVPPEAPGEMAEALISLVEAPARAARLGGALEAACRERFSVERMARETLALYAP